MLKKNASPEGLVYDTGVKAKKMPDFNSIPGCGICKHAQIVL